jgi:hypothetical protein
LTLIEGRYTMSKAGLLLRTLGVLGATVVGTVLGVSVPAHAEGSAVTHPFYADSGDSCRFGVTKGTLTWIAVGPLPVTRVVVSGSLLDRPLPDDPSTACRDPRYSSATFTAYRGTVVVDREQQRVDNGEITFRFELAAPLPGSVQPIDRVVIQVCRHALPGTTIPDYCGRAVEYRQPPTTSP